MPNFSILKKKIPRRSDNFGADEGGIAGEEFGYGADRNPTRLKRPQGPSDTTPDQYMGRKRLMKRRSA